MKIWSWKQSCFHSSKHNNCKHKFGLCHHEVHVNIETTNSNEQDFSHYQGFLLYKLPETDLSTDTENFRGYSSFHCEHKEKHGCNRANLWKWTMPQWTLFWKLIYNVFMTSPKSIHNNIYLAKFDEIISTLFFPWFLLSVLFISLWLLSYYSMTTLDKYISHVNNENALIKIKSLSDKIEMTILSILDNNFDKTEQYWQWCILWGCILLQLQWLLLLIWWKFWSWIVYCLYCAKVF